MILELTAKDIPALAGLVVVCELSAGKCHVDRVYMPLPCHAADEVDVTGAFAGHKGAVLCDVIERWFEDNELELKAGAKANAGMDQAKEARLA